MKKKFVLDILKEVEAGRLSADDALTRLKLEPIEELGFARVDLHRELRQGATEVIYGAGKTPEQISKIIGALMDNGAPTVLTTRMAQEAADRALQVLDTGKCDEDPHMQFQLCTKDDIETYKEYWGIE